MFDGETATDGGLARVSTDDGTLACEFGGTTHFAVAPDGTVTSGMPLHGFEHAAVVELGFDHESGAVHVFGDEGLHYTFRRP